jgi:hypothetical protein
LALNLNKSWTPGYLDAWKPWTRLLLAPFSRPLRLAEYGGSLNPVGKGIETLDVILERASAYISQLSATHNQPSTSLIDEIQRIELALDRVRTVVKKRAGGVPQTNTASTGINMELSLARERRRKISCCEPRSRMLALLAMKHIGDAIIYTQVNAGAPRSRNGIAVIPCPLS